MNSKFKKKNTHKNKTTTAKKKTCVESKGHNFCSSNKNQRYEESSILGNAEESDI